MLAVMRLGSYRMEFDGDRCVIQLQARFRHAVALVMCVLAQVGGMLLIFLRPVNKLSPEFGHLDWWSGFFLVGAGALGLASLPLSIMKEKKGITIDRLAKTVIRLSRDHSFDFPGARAEVVTSSGDGVEYSVALVVDTRKIFLLNNIDPGEAKRGADAINEFLRG